MILAAFCNTIHNPISIENVTEEERALNTYFLTEDIYHKLTEQSLLNTELIELATNDTSARIDLTPVLKGTKFYRRRNNITRSEYNSGGGEMTKNHILVELEAYSRAKTGKLLIILADQECPLHKMGICTTPCSKYIAKAPKYAFNYINYFPFAEFEPGKNLTSRCRSDVKLLSNDRKKEAAIEAKNTSSDTEYKLSLGYPILVLPAKTKQDIEYVKSTTVFDTTKNRCTMENGWALPFMLTQFGCNDVLEKFKLHCAKINKKKNKQNTVHQVDEVDGAIRHYKHGLFPETKITWGKFIGEPLDYIIKTDRVDVEKIRKINPTLYVLTPYSRQLYGLEATDLELLMDKCIDELDRVVDVGKYKGKTIEEVAKIDFREIMWLQNNYRKWENNRLSKDCMDFLSRMYYRKKK